MFCAGNAKIVLNAQTMAESTLKVTLAVLVFCAHLQFNVRSHEYPNESSPSAVYIFGDSTADSGNNNHLITVIKANFPPYGRDFVNHKPTGRFTNGRLAVDIISSLAGLPDTVPPYLDPQFQGEQILRGTSFASAASGYDDSTARAANVMNLGQQVDCFKEYKLRVASVVGGANASNIISRALYLLSTGSDDFANNYFLNLLKRRTYSVPQYQDFLLQSLSQFVKNIYNMGAQKIGVLGLPPFGCLPSQITLHNLVNDTCVEDYNEVAVSFNRKLIALLETMNYPGLTIAYIDVYDKLLDAVKTPTKYGFEEARRGCCGTGLLESSKLCNRHTPACADASKYLFWDSYHPTEPMYEILAHDIVRQSAAHGLI